jgi:hypothetical protein
MANPFSSSAAPLPSNPCTQISCASVFLGALGRPGSAYLCGPMRGFPSWNAAAFDECAGRWRDAGWLVVNPVGLASGLDVRSASEAQLDAVAGDPAWLRNVILADCSHVAKADALALLPGWEASFGATVEVSLALFLGLPLFCAVTMHRIVPLTLPWHRLDSRNNTPLPVIGARSSAGDYEDGNWSEVWRNLPDRGQPNVVQ